jgi:hypothetical protein
VSNIDDVTHGRQDIYLVVPSKNVAADVRAAFNGPTFKFQTQPHWDVYSGIFDTTIVLDTTSGAYFFVADAILEGRNRWITLEPSKNPVQIQVELRASSTSTAYDTILNYIHVEKSATDTLATPDTFDRDVLVHEYAHKLQWEFDFFDLSPSIKVHTWIQKTKWAVAATEGGADLFACILKEVPDPVFRNTYRNFSVTVNHNLENGERSVNSFEDSISANNLGPTCEGAVAGILWDIYDSGPPLLEDYSTFGVYPDPMMPNPDGIGDSLSKGPQGILSAMVDRMVNGHHPDSIGDFWDAWFQTPSLRDTLAMANIYYEHGDAITCCMGKTGDLNMNGTVELADLSALVSYLTAGSPIPPCHAEANVNQVGDIDLADMSALISYLTGGGFILPNCP